MVFSVDQFELSCSLGLFVTIMSYA